MDTSWIQPFLAEITECVSCGKCLADCPLYDYQRREEWSPRGKLNVLKWYLSSGGRPTPASAVMFFQCSLCLRCQDACPSGISMREIFQAARANLERLGLAPRAACTGRATHHADEPVSPACQAISGTLARVRGRGADRLAGVRLTGRRPAVPPPVPRAGEAGRLAVLLLSPLMVAAAPGAAQAAVEMFRQSGYLVESRILAGPSLFRRFWGGGPDRLGEAVAAEEASLPPDAARLFAEPELAAWWREARNGGSGHGPVVDLLEVLDGAAPETVTPLAGPFTILPPPLPLDRAGWAAWNNRWARLAPAGWQPSPDAWRAWRGEGLLPFYPASARSLGRCMLSAAAAAGLSAVLAASPRTLTWLHAAGAAASPVRLCLIPECFAPVRSSR